jgi:cell division protein ZapA
MPQITITIQNKPYTLSCPEGNENHVYRLSQKVNTYMDNLVKHGAILSNQGLLIFALLGMAEKIETQDEKIHSLEQSLQNALENSQRPVVIETSLAPDLLPAHPISSEIISTSSATEAVTLSSESLSEPSDAENTLAQAEDIHTKELHAITHKTPLSLEAFTDERESVPMDEALLAIKNTQGIEQTLKTTESELSQEALSHNQTLEKDIVLEQLSEEHITPQDPLNTEAEKAAEAFLAAATLSLAQWEETVSESSDNLQVLKKKAETLQSFSKQTSHLENEMAVLYKQVEEEKTAHQATSHQAKIDLELADDSSRMLNDVLNRIAALAQKLETSDL